MDINHQPTNFVLNSGESRLWEDWLELQQEIESRLREAFPDAVIELRDTGGGNHWYLKISSPLLHGTSRVKQHQAIYKPLNDLIASDRLHALQIDVVQDAN